LFCRGPWWLLVVYIVGFRVGRLRSGFLHFVRLVCVRVGARIKASIRSAHPHPRHLPPRGPCHWWSSGLRSRSSPLHSYSHYRLSSYSSSFATWRASLRQHVSPGISPRFNTTRQRCRCGVPRHLRSCSSPTTLLYGIRSCRGRHGGRRVTQWLPHQCVQSMERGSNRGSKGAFVDVLTWQLVSRSMVCFDPRGWKWRTLLATLQQPPSDL
jgi:hypothetical protein